MKAKLPTFPSLPANISVVARSPDLRPDEIEVVVILPTFKRPEHLLRTMASIREQRTARKHALIVMENEAEVREGATVASPLFLAGEMNGILIVAHDRGNCSAYNAGMTTALAELPNWSTLLIIDDDEIASPDWLERMCATREQLGVDLVGGPQLPVFARPEQEKWARHPVFTPHYDRTGQVPALYSSGNLLMTREVLERMPPPFLDPQFNFTGGGDSDFLSRCSAAGFSFGWCAEAPVYETIPERRVEPDWIRSRSLRNGMLSALIERRRRAPERFGHLRTVAKSLALLAASPPRGLLKAVKTRSVAAGMYPVYIGIGRVLAEFGYKNEQYRQPEKN